MKEKKEIGKLIELLNEYKGKEEWTIECDVPHNDWYSEYAYEHEELIIISKKFGFIKWLVENDKIEFNMPMETLSFREYYDIKKSDFLIALLSIQDKPIDFLISILK